MDHAYGNDATRQLDLGPASCPSSRPRATASTRGDNREMCRRRIESEHLFRRPKGCRRVSSRFEKPHGVFRVFPVFVLIVNAPRS